MRQEIADVLLTSPRLVVDLREVTFMDSSGLATLIMANRSVVKGAMRLVVTRTRMLRLFDLAGVMSVLPVFDSVQAATEAPGPLDAEAAD
jgi:anti-anti-sigma factor